MPPRKSMRLPCPRETPALEELLPAERTKRRFIAGRADSHAIRGKAFRAAHTKQKSAPLPGRGNGGGEEALRAVQVPGCTPLSVNAVGGMPPWRLWRCKRFCRRFLVALLECEIVHGSVGLVMAIRCLRHLKQKAPLLNRAAEAMIVYVDQFATLNLGRSVNESQTAHATPVVLASCSPAPIPRVLPWC